MALQFNPPNEILPNSIFIYFIDFQYQGGVLYGDIAMENLWELCERSGQHKNIANWSHRKKKTGKIYLIFQRSSNCAISSDIFIDSIK